MNTIDFSPVFAQIIEIVLTVAIPAITYQVFTLASNLRQFYLKRVNAEVADFIEVQVVNLVKAAQQLETTKQIAAGGKSKYNWVISQATALLAEYNITVSEKQLKAIVEAAINDGLQKGNSLFTQAEPLQELQDLG